MTGKKAHRPAAFTGLVLAGERGPLDPLTDASGACCKALVPVGGTPMVLRVLSALERSEEVGSILLSGPTRTQIAQNPELKDGIAEGRWGWQQPRATPSRSTSAALQSLQTAPVLLTTADHALLHADVVDHFCAAARRTGCDLAVALADHTRVMEAFPDVRRTALRFRGGAFCGCNLYAFMTPESRRVAEFWGRMENDRKRPWRMVRTLGWAPLLAYLTRLRSLEETLQMLSRHLGLRICPVITPFPEAAVDVDKPSDRDLAERILLDRSQPTLP
jgi:GTP:adenosylcobinamide-phosphate guanylyltransferase